MSLAEHKMRFAKKYAYFCDTNVSTLRHRTLQARSDHFRPSDPFPLDRGRGKKNEIQNWNFRRVVPPLISFFNPCPYRVELAIQSWLEYTMYPFMANYLKVFSHQLVASSPTVGWVPLNQHHWLETPIVDRWKWLDMVGNGWKWRFSKNY